MYIHYLPTHYIYMVEINKWTEYQRENEKLQITQLGLRKMMDDIIFHLFNYIFKLKFFYILLPMHIVANTVSHIIDDMHMDNLCILITY